MRTTIHTSGLLLFCLVMDGCDPGHDVREDEAAAPIAPAGELSVLNSIPADLPAEIPIYPDTTVRSGQRTDTGFNVTLLTGPDFSSIAAYYREQFSSPDWAVVADDEIEVDGRRTLRLIADSDLLKCTVDVSPAVAGDGETRAHGITIYVEEKDQVRSADRGRK